MAEDKPTIIPVAQGGAVFPDFIGRMVQSDSGFPVAVHVGGWEIRNGQFTPSGDVVFIPPQFPVHQGESDAGTEAPDA